MVFQPANGRVAPWKVIYVSVKRLGVGEDISYEGLSKLLSLLGLPDVEKRSSIQSAVCRARRELKRADAIDLVPVKNYGYKIVRFNKFEARISSADRSRHREMMRRNGVNMTDFSRWLAKLTDDQSQNVPDFIYYIKEFAHRKASLAHAAINNPDWAEIQERARYLGVADHVFWAFFRCIPEAIALEMSKEQLFDLLTEGVDQVKLLKPVSPGGPMVIVDN